MSAMDPLVGGMCRARVHLMHGHRNRPPATLDARFSVMASTDPAPDAGDDPFVVDLERFRPGTATHFTSVDADLPSGLRAMAVICSNRMNVGSAPDLIRVAADGSPLLAVSVFVGAGVLRTHDLTEVQPFASSCHPLRYYTPQADHAWSFPADPPFMCVSARPLGVEVLRSVLVHAGFFGVPPATGPPGASRAVMRYIMNGSFHSVRLRPPAALVLDQDTAIPFEHADAPPGMHPVYVLVCTLRHVPDPTLMLPRDHGEVAALAREALFHKDGVVPNKADRDVLTR
ncbi:MAG: hypothetical protein AAFS07_19110, partial [Pseudomonadota bacterium]